jgi:hypothetical protein
VASETCEDMTNAGEPWRSGVSCEVRCFRADKSTANLGDASSVYLSQKKKGGETAPKINASPPNKLTSHRYNSPSTQQRTGLHAMPQLRTGMAPLQLSPNTAVSRLRSRLPDKRDSILGGVKGFYSFSRTESGTHTATYFEENGWRKNDRSVKLSTHGHKTAKNIWS